MRPEDLPEDIDGKQENNPYDNVPYSDANGGYQSIFLTRIFALPSLLWHEREYWRHWKRVKHDTGRWPFWSAMYHLLFVVLISINMLLFMVRRDAEDWSAPKSWLIGIGFALLWIAILVVGRDVIRQYEAKLYTKHEEDHKHSASRG